MGVTLFFLGGPKDGDSFEFDDVDGMRLELRFPVVSRDGAVAREDGGAPRLVYHLYELDSVSGTYIYGGVR